MTADKIFHLVHSLTKEQKYLVSRYGFSERDANTRLLYDRILKEKVFSPKAARRIQGKEFKGHAKYWSARVRLAERIIAGLAAFEDQNVPARPFLQWALQLEAHEVAGRFLSQALLTALEKEDFALLSYLLELQEDLELQYRVRIPLQEKVPEKSHILARIENFRNWKALLRDFRNFLRERNGSHSSTDWRLLPQRLRALPLLSKKAEKFRLKLLSGWHSFQQQFDQAILQQEKLLQCYARRPDENGVEYISEMGLLVSMHVQLHQKDPAVHWMMQLSGLQPPSAAAAHVQARWQVTLPIMIGEHFGDLDLLRRGQALLRQHQDLFEVRHRVYQHLLLALGFFYFRDFAGCNKQLAAIRQFKRANWKHFKWEVLALSTLSAWELNEIGLSESFLGSLKRGTDTSDAYLKSCNQVIQKLVLGEHRNWDQLASELRLAKADISNSNRIYALDLAFYLESRKMGLSMAGMIQAQPRKASRFKQVP